MKNAGRPRHSLLQTLLLAGMAMLLAGCAQTVTKFSDVNSGTTAESISSRYLAGGINTVATADRALAEVRTERPTIRKQLEADEIACYERFFTNLCLNRVEERERSALEQLREVEVEANAFKRRERVERRTQRQAPKENHRLPIPADMNAAPKTPGEDKE